VNAIAALAYADVHGLFNPVTDIRKKPRRLLLWLVFAAGIGLNLWARSMALAEAALLIGIASWRLDGRTDILRTAT